ncbi:hypothetical protein [Pelagimonas varians]|uniref:Sodium Bile acid symporter family protein n=1 Tax=Pelagimonas varians TaxID=696760 RepID=A0A238KUI4_9RHOB|nr:hypothetical protein [Pelagimonas varians]PYG28312.1 putative Na+-dependent transporter [Pelagimonas varians]SMX46445.1 hypothetical protein PEV8663_03289 [Pelagimonas varians]
MLHAVARHAKLCLVAGLIVGAALPDLAGLLRPWLGLLIGALLTITAFRIGPKMAFGSRSELPALLAHVLSLQLVAPLMALTVVLLLFTDIPPFLLAVILMLAAPSVTGAPNFAIMTGHDPAPALRILVLGTALFPLTMLPVLWALPELGQPGAAMLRLIATILLAVGAGFLLRVLRPKITQSDTENLDGLAALLLAVVVVGLMSAIGPLLRDDPMTLLMWLAGVMSVNLGLQLVSLFTMGRLLNMPEAVPVSIIWGNRNIALFLIALPAEVTEPLLIFIGCYQIPMYLTPILMKPIHNRFGRPNETAA